MQGFDLEFGVVFCLLDDFYLSVKLFKQFECLFLRAAGATHLRFYGVPLFKSRWRDPLVLLWCAVSVSSTQ